MSDTSEEREKREREEGKAKTKEKRCPSNRESFDELLRQQRQLLQIGDVGGGSYEGLERSRGSICW